jgi:hypothetical protein
MTKNMHRIQKPINGARKPWLLPFLALNSCPKISESLLSLEGVKEEDESPAGARVAAFY